MKIYNPENVTILYDSVLAKFPKQEEKKKTEAYKKNKEGIYIPDKEEDTKPDPFITGIAIRIGTGYMSPEGGIQPLRVQPLNEVVIDSRNSANNIVFECADEGFEYRLIRESNIIMVIDGFKETTIREDKRDESKDEEIGPDDQNS